MTRNSARRFATLAGLLLAGIVLAQGSTASWTITAPFDRIQTATLMSTGQSVANDCPDPDANRRYRSAHWPSASATLQLEQGGAYSHVAIELTGVRPSTYYSVWLRLTGTDATGATYGGSPFTGAPGTALVPGSELAETLRATGEGNGSTAISNGFWSDEHGNATFTTELDFPIIGGAYPFHMLPDFDASDPRLTAEAPRNHPVAIPTSGIPFTLRVASHCTDDLGHGLNPGPHEGWFDWTADVDAIAVAETD